MLGQLASHAGKVPPVQGLLLAATTLTLQQNRNIDSSMWTLGTLTVLEICERFRAEKKKDIKFKFN